MKKLIVVLILALLAAPAFAGKFIDRDGPKVEGEYICTFVDGANARGLAAQLAGANPGVSVKGTFNALNSAHFSAASANQIRGLANNPNVDICEPNLIATVDGSQSGATWGIDRVDQRNLPLDGTYTWDYTASTVDAWVLDTGVRLTHNEFGGRATAPTTCNGYGTVDGHGHGTHVGGTVGGATYGVAKSVRIKSIKVCSDAGSCPSNATSCGLNYVANNAVANNSVGNFSIGGPYSATSNSNMANAIAAGVFFAVAAGNDSQDACNYSPASEPTAHTVGSTTSSDARSSFSNYGSCVDINAPGSSILSAWYTSDSATNTIGGTSMASPHVCGAGALVLSELGPQTPAQVGNALNAKATSGVLSGLNGSPNLLLYTRAGGGPPPACTSDAECNNGLFCDGAETCNLGTGLCESGTAPCTGGLVCNESTDACEQPPACAGTLYSGTSVDVDLVTNNGGCNASGTFTGDLECSVGAADLDLYLQYYSCGWGCSWANAASSTSAGCDESINSTQGSGEWRWLVDHYSGPAEDFTLCANQC